MTYYAGMNLENTKAKSREPHSFRVLSVDAKGIFVSPYWKLDNGFVHYGVVRYISFEDVETIRGMKPAMDEFSFSA